MTPDRAAALESLASAVDAWIVAAKASRALRGDFKLLMAEQDAKREMIYALSRVKASDAPKSEPRDAYRKVRARLLDTMRRHAREDGWRCGAT